jgi:hypothetical protein
VRIPHPWTRIKLWAGILSLMLGWSMWMQPAPSCCCCQTDTVSSQCQCQPELCQCAPKDHDRGLTLLPLPPMVLTSVTRVPQACPGLASAEPTGYLGPRLAAARRPAVQPRAPPRVLQFIVV